MIFLMYYYLIKIPAIQQEKLDNKPYFVQTINNNKLNNYIKDVN